MEREAILDKFSVAEGMITFSVEVLFKVKEILVELMWLLSDTEKKTMLC